MLPSLPAWECGLKLWHCYVHIDNRKVTPCVGVWIEIGSCRRLRSCPRVTPCVGVWIEITTWRAAFQTRTSSLPAWECGLKYLGGKQLGPKLVTPCVGVWIEIGKYGAHRHEDRVTPCVGVWIEILADIWPTVRRDRGHSLRGSVD